MTPAEVQAAIQAFMILEPELQKMASDLIHMLAGHNAKLQAAIEAAKAAGVPAEKLPTS